MNYFIVYVARLSNKEKEWELTGNYDIELSGNISDISKVRKIENLIQQDLARKGLPVDEVTIVSWRLYDN